LYPRRHREAIWLAAPSLTWPARKGPALLAPAIAPEAIVVEEKDHRHEALIAAIDVLNDRERRVW
jgi:hypothetical protein